MNTDKKYFLSWQKQMLGPHSVDEIKSLLNDRKIHSLFKVQGDEGEVLVREFLAGLNDDRKRETAAQQNASLSQPAKRVAQVVEAIPEFGSDHRAVSREMVGSPTAPLPPPPPPPPFGVEPKFGYALASLVLSLLFIIPLVNLVSWVMSLIFGYMFLFAAKGDRTLRGYTHAWCGIWLTYIFGVFYLISFVASAIGETRDLSIWIGSWLLGFHIVMIVGAIIASVVSGLLIAATKMLTGTAPKTGVAFVAGTLGVMVGFTLLTLVGLIWPDSIATGKVGLLVGLSVGLAVFLIQALAWSEMIRVREGEKLGPGKAAIVSIFCSVCLLFLVLVLIVFVKLFE